MPLRSLLEEIQKNFHLGKAGYREGVVLVPVDPANFIGQIVILKDGDELIGKFSRRGDNEEPRKDVKVLRTDNVKTAPLVAVDVVLYHHSVLEEDNDVSDPNADWEVITFLTKISEEDQPMPPDTLLANHFGASGGTNTLMDDQKFVNELRRSFEFWKDKALIRSK